MIELTTAALQHDTTLIVRHSTSNISGRVATSAARRMYILLSIVNLLVATSIPMASKLPVYTWLRTGCLA